MQKKQILQIWRKKQNLPENANLSMESKNNLIFPKYLFLDAETLQIWRKVIKFFQVPGHPFSNLHKFLANASNLEGI